MNKTQIEWVKNPDGSQGYTWNPITGCLNGCEYCYAYRLAKGRLRSRYLANTNLTPLPKGYLGHHEYPHADPFFPRFWQHRLWEMVWQQKTKPKGIFVCDMGELFGDWIPPEWQKKVFDAIAVNPQHRFYLLTKQPQNLIKFSPFPDNCWMGVTTTGPDMAMEAISSLVGIQAKTKYLSIEPLLLGKTVGGIEWRDVLFSVIDWVILGSQTKPYKPPEISWVKEIVEACDKAGIPVFQKDNLKPIFPTPTNTLRQEMPR